VKEGIVRRGISEHIRGNVVGYVALFLALSGGTAYALEGSNTVFSDDIVDNEVKTQDIRTVITDDLGDAAVTTVKIADGAVTTGKLADGAITGAKVQDGTLTAADISPLATSVELAPGTVQPGCVPQAWPVPGIAPGDRVVVNADPDIDPNVFAQAAVQAVADSLVLRICNLSGAPIDTVEPSTFSFVVIR
jgi:hypothetical protein